MGADDLSEVDTPTAILPLYSLPPDQMPSTGKRRSFEPACVLLLLYSSACTWHNQIRKRANRAAGLWKALTYIITYIGIRFNWRILEMLINHDPLLLERCGFRCDRNSVGDTTWCSEGDSSCTGQHEQGRSN